MHVIAGKAVCFRLAMTEEFKTYQRQVVANAKRLAETLMGRGFEVVSGGTDTHLFLLDLTSRDLTGSKAQRWLEAASITVNRNAVPFDKQKPFITSGIRIGTPALTTRGMREAEMDTIAGWIADVLASTGNEAVIARVREGVRELTAAFPLYPELT
jgi:glycine hydroxymethyltransferase